MRVTFDCACNWKGRGVGWGVRSLAWLGTSWIPLPGERFESFGGKGDIYIPVPVIGKGGGGGGGDGGVGGHDTAGLHCRTEGSSFER